jgi:hypothetical protein
MPGFRRRIAPIILHAVLEGDRRIQRFVEVEFFEAHDVHIDIRVRCSVWRFDAIKYVDTASLAKGVMRYRVFSPIFGKLCFAGKKTKRFGTNLNVPESQLATEAAIAFQRTVVEINPGFKPH